MKIYSDFETAKQISHTAQNQNYSSYCIVKLNGKLVMFFHNDLPDSKDGKNTSIINLCKELINKNKLHKFICCYPEVTGIDSKYQFVKGNGLCDVSFANIDKGYFYISYQK